jgi:hypothetical protein
VTRRHHRLAACALSALLAVVVVACGGDDDDDPPATTKAAPAPTTTPPTSARTTEQEVEATVQDVLDLLRAQASNPNPDDERLAQLMVDPLLSRVRSSAEERQRANQAYELSPESRNDILSTEVEAGGTATIVICSISADQLVDLDTGEVIASGTSTFRDEVSLRTESGRWVVAEFATMETWEGARSCA